METELQLKHLAPYLPYGLKIMITKSGRIIEVSGAYKLLHLEIVDTNGQDYSFQIWPLKPLFIPLGDLALINQATGNPYFIDVLQAVCPLPFQGRNNKFWKCMITGTDKKIKSTGFLEIDNKFNDYSFSIDLENGDLLIYHGDDLSVPDGLFNYFNELAKYHFDFQNLIVHGLALNKLDYEKE